MVGAFAIFATLGMIDFKMMGVGLAVTDPGPRLTVRGSNP